MMNDAVLKAQQRDRLTLIREILNPTRVSVENFIKEYDKLDIFAKIRLMRRLRNFELEFTHNLKIFLLDRINTSIYLTLTAYKKTLSLPLDPQQIQEIQTDTLHYIVLQPFKGKTLDQRIDHSTSHTFSGIKREISFGISRGLTGAEVAKTIKSYFLTSGQVAGGSALMWNTRILVGEQNRAFQMTARKVLEAGGIQAIQWTPHSDKPMSSLCQHYATDNQGIWLVKNIPDYPHPGCCCSLEPIF